LFFLSFGFCILLTLPQKLKKVFPRLEPQGSSTIDFLYSALENLLVFQPLCFDAHYKSALHDLVSVR